MKTLVLLLAVCLTAVAVSANDGDDLLESLTVTQEKNDQQYKSSQSNPSQSKSQQYRQPLYRAPGRPNYPDTNVREEKRFQALTADGELFWMDSTNGELWRFDPFEPGWDFLGRPRGAGNRRKGTYLLHSYKPGELLILDTDSGEAWWVRGATWVRIDDPSTRTRRDKNPRSWDRMWEQFKNP